MSIQIKVDLRTNHCDIRNQGERPTCLAFALSDLNCAQHAETSPFSAEYLYANAVKGMPGWRPGDGLTLECGLSSVLSPGQPKEEVHAYTADEPSVPLQDLAVYDNMYTNKFVRMEPSVQTILESLNSGRSIGLVISMTYEFYIPDEKSGLISFRDAALPHQRHAVLAVGYGRLQDTDEVHILIRNSWGEGWGKNGYAWLSRQHVETHATHFFGAY